MLGARSAIAVLAVILATSTVGGLADAVRAEGLAEPETQGGGSLVAPPPASPKFDIRDAGNSALLDATVTIATEPAGLDVIVNGTRSPSPVSLTAPLGATVTIGAPSPQPKVGPGTRYTWLSWSDGGDVTHVITVGGSTTLVARFQTEYRLRVEAPVPGSGGDRWYFPGALAYAHVAYTLFDVAPGERLVFYGWSGDASGMGTTSGPILMNGPKVAIARYGREVFLEIETAHGRGIGSRWHTPGTLAYALVTPSRVEVGPGARQAFTGWSGDASGATVLSDPILMNGPKRAVATWRAEYLVTLESQFVGVQGEGWYAAGSVATLQALPHVASGPFIYAFAGWTGDIVSPDPTVTVVVDRPLTIIATWALLGAFGPFLSIIVAAASAVAAVIVVFWIRRHRPWASTWRSTWRRYVRRR